MQEWLDTYNTDSERAAKALAELEKAFDMPYMGTDRCDDAISYLKRRSRIFAFQSIRRRKALRPIQTLNGR